MATTELPEIVFASLYTEKQAPHRKRLYLPIRVVLSSGCELELPKGFVSDLATVPRIFWGVIQPSGRHDLAVLVHDYLLEQGVCRKQADKELLHFLRLTKVHWLKCAIMYASVRFYSILTSKK